MLKWIGLIALVAAGAVMTLGCVRGLAAPTAAVEAQTSTVKPMSIKLVRNVLKGHQEPISTGALRCDRSVVRGRGKPTDY